MNTLFRKYSIAFALAGVAVLFSCNNKEAEESESSSTVDTNGMSAKTSMAKNVFYSIPSPIEISSLLKKAGATYDKKYLNSANNVSRYTSTPSMALNLGVYGADLSFTSIFDQSQESMSYLNGCSKLSQGLGIASAFNETILKRIEKNLSNKDSLLDIVADAYWTSDATLKENQQENVASLIIAGGWIEGLYIATQIASSTNNKAIMQRIGEQKLSLNNLIGLLDAYKNDDAVKTTSEQLVDLKTVFDPIEMTNSRAAATTDEATGVTTISNESTVDLSVEQLKAISEKIQVIRNSIIK